MKTRVLMTVAALLAGSTVLSPSYAQEGQPAVTETSAGSELLGLLCEHLDGLDEAQLTSFLQGYEAGFLDAREPEPTGVPPAQTETNTNPTIGDAQPATSEGSQPVADAPTPSGGAATGGAAAPAGGADAGATPAPAADAGAGTAPAGTAAPPPPSGTGDPGAPPPGPSTEGTPPSGPPAGAVPTEPAVHPMVAACQTAPDQTLAQAFASRYGLADPEEARQPGLIPEPSPAPEPAAPAGAAAPAEPAAPAAPAAPR